MVKSIANYGVFWTEDSLKEPSVGVESTGKQDGILKIIIVRNNLFELFVYILRATDKTY